MFKRTSTCIRVPKKKHKVLLLEFVSRLWSFFSPVLVEHWFHIWLMLHDCVLSKAPKTRFHICETRQRPIPSIQIRKHHNNLDSATFCVRRSGSSCHKQSYPHSWKQCKSNQLVSIIYIYCSKDARFISLNWNWNQILLKLKEIEKLKSDGIMYEKLLFYRVKLWKDESKNLCLLF